MQVVIAQKTEQQEIMQYIDQEVYLLIKSKKIAPGQQRNVAKLSASFSGIPGSTLLEPQPGRNAGKSASS